MLKRNTPRVNYSQLNGSQEEEFNPSIDLQLDNMTEDLEESQDIILRATPSKKTRYTNKDKKRSWG